MRGHVASFIKHCPFCQKTSYLKSPIHSVPFTTAAYEPMERQNWDSIGPLTLATGDQVHILVAIDCFTRWVELWMISGVNSDSTKLPFLQHFGRYGIPRQVLTDNGSQFINTTMEEIRKMTGYEHITTVPYSK